MLEGRRTDVRLRLDAHSRRLASGLHDLSSIRSIYIVSFAKRFAQAISNFTGFDTFLASTAQIAILPQKARSLKGRCVSPVAWAAR